MKPVIKGVHCIGIFETYYVVILISPSSPFLMVLAEQKSLENYISCIHVFPLYFS